MTPTNKIISVLIVDDEPLHSAALQKFLSSNDDIEVLGISKNGLKALQQLESIMPDVILCDVRMPVMDGVEFAQAVKSRQFPCRIVGLTTFDEERSMLDMLHAGCFGFILKNSSPHEISEAVRVAASGGTTISPQPATRLRKYLLKLNNLPNGRLPKREWEVLVLLQQGRNNTAIAEELFISEASVKKAVTRLMQRYNVNSRLELVVTTRELK